MMVLDRVPNADRLTPPSAGDTYTMGEDNEMHDGRAPVAAAT